MYNTILIKRRTSGAAGAPAALSGGELAFNEIDSTLYYGSANGVIAIAGSGTFVDKTTSQVISGDKTFLGLTTLSSTTFSTDSVIDFNGNILTNLSDPVLAGDAATKSYVDTNITTLSSSLESQIAALDSNIGTNITSQIQSVSSSLNAASASLSALATITQSITSDVEVGAITTLQVIPSGTTLQEFAESLLFKVYYPTFTAPTASLTTNRTGNIEVGTTGITLTHTLNRGSINGQSVSGVWQAGTSQGVRSGVATNYDINGVNNGTTNTLTSAGAVIMEGTNTYTSTVTYAQGPQPIDSKGTNFSSPLVTGTITSTVTVAGRRNAFFGLNSAGNSSALIRALGNTSFNPANGSTFTISIPAGTTSVLFAYPATLRDVSSVIYTQGLNSDVKGVFGTPTLVSVEGANGYTAITYKVYRYQPVEAYSALATYNVTI